ncbi:MFS transporter [Chloroflexales bacterium ZM16-3]|nr:MFS transporter [Chloroflexales bacterium ZM16-3]
MTRQRVVLITIGVMMSLFMASMESTVIATAMPTIVSQLGGLASYSWVFAIYMLTSTTAGPIFGKLSDIYGRRPIYMAAIALFLAGSLLCGVSTSMPMLIGARALQGLGAGGLMPMAFIIVGDIFTFEQRAKMQGLFSGVWGVSSVIGPLIGGFLVDQISWHWVFLINVPPGLIAAALVWTAWQDPARGEAKRPAIDYAGAALLSVGVVTLLLGLSDLSSPLSWVLLAVAAASTAALIVVELRAAAPILPVRLLMRDRMFAVSCAHGVLAGWVLFGSMSYVPLFVQGVLGTSATQAGSTLTPMLLGWVITSIVGSRLLLRFSYRTMAIGGMSGFVLGTFLLSRVRPDMSQLELVVALALMGFGMGSSIPAFLIAVQSSVTRSELGSATATVQFSRTIGGTFGVAVLGVILAASLNAALQAAGIAPDAVPLGDLIGGTASSAASLEGGARAALAIALSHTFGSTLWIAVFALAVTFLAPKGNVADLRNRRAAEDAAAAEAIGVH